MNSKNRFPQPQTDSPSSIQFELELFTPLTQAKLNWFHFQTVSLGFQPRQVCSARSHSFSSQMRMGKRVKLTSRALEIAKNRNSSLCDDDFNFINILAAARHTYFRLAQNKRSETDLSVRQADLASSLCAQQVRGKKMNQKHAKQEPKHRPHDTRRNMIILCLL